MKAHVQAIKATVHEKRVSRLCSDLEDLIDKLKAFQASLVNNDELTTFTSTEGPIVSAAQAREQSSTEITDAYISGLQSNDALLATLLNKNIEADHRRQVLEDLKDDLEMKLEFLHKGTFIEQTKFVGVSWDPNRTEKVTTTLAGSVFVKAETFFGNRQNASGYVVYFVLKGWVKDPTCYQSLGVSPTQGRPLPPGPHYFWAVKGSTKTERVLMRVGDAGPNQLIELAVPHN